MKKVALQELMKNVFLAIKKKVKKMNVKNVIMDFIYQLIVIKIQNVNLVKKSKIVNLTQVL